MAGVRKLVELIDGDEPTLIASLTASPCEFLPSDVFQDVYSDNGRRGTTCFHLAVSRGKSMELIGLFLDLARKDVDKRDILLAQRMPGGDTPLHQAIDISNSKLDVKLINWLIHESPKALKVKNATGKTPLDDFEMDFKNHKDHRRASEILALLKKYTIPSPPPGKPVSLHQLILDGAPKSALEASLAADPTQAFAVVNGKLAFHLLCEFDCDFSKMTWLLRKNPKAAETPDDDRSYCLHLAARNPNVTEGAMRVIVDSFPKAVKARDLKLKRPFECRVRRYLGYPPFRLPDPPTEVDKFLFRCNPQSNTFRYTYSLHADSADTDRWFGQLADNYIEHLGSQIRIAEMALSASGDKSTAPTLSPVEKNGFVTFVSSVSVTELCSEGLGAEKVCSIIQKSRPETARALAKARSLDDRLAIDHAVPKIRQVLQQKLLFMGRFDMGVALHKSATAIVYRAADKSQWWRDKFNAAASNHGRDGMPTVEKWKIRYILEELGVVVEDDLTFEEKFNNMDSDRSGSLLECEFAKFCQDEFGEGGRPVVIKFMKNRDQFNREKRAREENKLDPKYVMSVIDTFDVQTNEDFKRALKENNESDFSRYECALILSSGDKNLDVVFRSERPDLHSSRLALLHVARCLNHMHEHNLVHGDVKPSNILATNYHFKIIDLDATSKIGTTAGAKFSSGVLPPELLYKCKDKGDVDKFNQYFREEKLAADVGVDDDAVALWNKIKPRASEESPSSIFVVRTWKASSIVAPRAVDAKKNAPLVKGGHEEAVPGKRANGIKTPKNAGSTHREHGFRLSSSDAELLEIIEPSKDPQAAVGIGLPYDLQKACPSQDMWALGLVMFLLLSGKPLFPINRDDDAQSGDAMRSICEWTDDAKQKIVFQTIDNTFAQHLLLSLLAAHPGDRPKSMREVLEHPFFTFKGGSLQTSLEGAKVTDSMIAEMREKLEREAKEKTIDLERQLFNVREDLEKQAKQAEIAKQALHKRSHEAQAAQDAQKTAEEEANKKLAELEKQLEESKSAAVALKDDKKADSADKSAVEKQILEMLEKTMQMQWEIKESTNAAKEKLSRIESLAEKIAEVSDRILKETKQIHVLAQSTNAKIEHSTSSILRAVVDSADITVPTTFVILPRKLDAGESATHASAADLIDLAKSFVEIDSATAMKSAQTMAKKFKADPEQTKRGWLSQAKSLFKKPEEIVKVVSGLEKKYEEMYGELVKTVATNSHSVGDKLQSIAGAVAGVCDHPEDLAADVLRTGLQSLKKRYAVESYWLYLVDELTGLPVKGEHYPIEITKKSKMLEKALPYMKVGIKAIKIANGVAGVAKMFGVPLPLIPKDMLSSVSEEFDLLDQDSSVEEFDVLSKALAEESSGEGNFRKLTHASRGAELKELHNYILEHDKDAMFCGLIRIANRETGNVLWTTKAGHESILSKEKEAEERLMKCVSGGDGGVASTTDLLVAENEKLLDKNAEKDNEIDELKRQLEEMRTALAIPVVKKAEDQHGHDHNEIEIKRLKAIIEDVRKHHSQQIQVLTAQHHLLGDLLR